MNGDRLLRAHRVTTRWRDGLWIAMSAGFDGIWLGLLDHARLARFDESFHAHPAPNRISYTGADHNLGGLFDWEAAAIEEHFTPGWRVVVTSAGAGREVVELLERGFDPVGYEPNVVLVTAGKELLGDRADRLRTCERDVFPADTPPCDAVIVGWGSYTLIAGRSRRLEFLRGAHRVLAPGGMLLCSFLVRAPGLQRYFAVTNATAAIIRRLRRAERPQLGDAVHENFAHFFTREEIEAELAAAGFRTIACSAAPYGVAVAVAE